MNCPICNTDSVVVKSEFVYREFRKEKFKVFEQYYFCNKCNNDFTTSKQDELAVSQVYNQYREKYNIPFPEQLTAIKKEYGLNSTNFAKILGFGVNQFANYEKGEIPNLSNATLLSLCLAPQEMLKIIERKKDVLSDTLYKKVIKQLNELLENEDLFDLKNLFFDARQIPNRYSGYKPPSFEKFVNMILFYITNAPFKTRLNKLLFYADFNHFKNHCFSISGIKYAAIPNGPVPDQYATIFGIIERNGFLSTELIDDFEYEGFVSKTEFDGNLFTDEELKTMQSVFDTFQYKKTKEIIDLSHKEKAWTENKKTNSKLISYLDFAFQLSAL